MAPSAAQPESSVLHSRRNNSAFQYTLTAMQQNDNRTVDLASFGDTLDTPTFEQILEMDDNEEREFSRGLVLGFFVQAEGTFAQMESALKSRNLSKLSELGHFLKGSSATLGLTKVKDACEKIQHFGAQKDESGTIDVPDKDISLANVRKVLTEVRVDYGDISRKLKRFYGEPVQ
ncbi:hypothetical protein FQN57_000734 [Myotisia sp. PD_48]|nr:hypothetical protein FQN57_000734 [Myotisia sp. PD_48]